MTAIRSLAINTPSGKAKAVASSAITAVCRYSVARSAPGSDQRVRVLDINAAKLSPSEIPLRRL